MKTVNKMVASVAVLGCLVGSASALQLQSGPGYGPYQVSPGGEFSLAVVEGTLDLSGYSSAATTKTRGLGLSGYDSFQSFCIENGDPAEYIYEDEKVVAVQSTSASFGSQPPDGDRISVGTGWLYSQFASGVWESETPGYDYENPGRSNGSKSSAALLQQAIWLLEGESSLATAENNVYVRALVAEFTSLTLAQADGGERYGVYALNLTGSLRDGTTHRQDQLYYNGHSVVPDGGMTMALFGCALAGLAGLRRRLS